MGWREGQGEREEQRRGDIDRRCGRFTAERMQTNPMGVDTKLLQLQEGTFAPNEPAAASQERTTATHEH